MMSSFLSRENLQESPFRSKSRRGRSTLSLPCVVGLNSMKSTRNTREVMKFTPGTRMRGFEVLSWEHIASMRGTLSIKMVLVPYSTGSSSSWLDPDQLTFTPGSIMLTFACKTASSPLRLADKCPTPNCFYGREPDP